MARVFEGQRTFLHPVLRWLEVLTYKVTGVKEDVEQRWTQYTASLLSFSLFGFLLDLPAAARAGVAAVQSRRTSTRATSRPTLAFNTATSFVTNTNWQAYSRRIHAELLRADGGADRAELRVGGGRHGDRDRPDPRLRAAGEEDHRQLLGGCDARHGLRPAAALDRRRRCSCARRAWFRT